MLTKVKCKRLLSILLLSSQLLALAAQQGTGPKPHLPVVGQKGKDVVWVPSPPELIEAMFRLVRLTEKDTLLDLGSGDGRLVIAAAKAGAYGIGVEFNPELVELSRRNADKAGLSDRTLFIASDLFNYKPDHATVISLFLLDQINNKLKPRLLALRPGTRIVSNTFTMGDWKPDRDTIIDYNPNNWNNAHLWIVPARADGIWRISGNALSIRQTYQFISGTFVSEDAVIPITDGRISGSAITFSIGKRKYSGLIEGEKMSGTISTELGRFKWEAFRTDYY
jgi:SAM-dependent methyltransferase